MEVTRIAGPRQFEHLYSRLALKRSLDDFHATRRLNRLGITSYRNVRQARKTYMAAKRHVEDLIAQGAE